MFLPDLFNLGTAFKQHFELVQADTDALRDDVYRIRHQVYCEELAFEPQRPDRREFDEYDSQSLHLLMRSVKTGECVGCTRIVRANESDPSQLLPFEKTCAETLDRSIVDSTKLPRHAIAEISRLAVIGKFRKRKSEPKQATPSISNSDFGTRDQPRFPYIPIGLYLGTIELARLHHIRTLFVLTERRLAGHFKKLGVDIRTIGGPVEHRGERIPSMLDPDEIVRNLKTLIKPLYRVIAADIAASHKDQQNA